MPIFYHYTDEEGAKNIIRSGTIQASLKHMTRGDTAHGNGVYLTSLNPWTSSKDEIMMNNWGNKNTTTREKMKRVFILSIPKADIKKAKKTRRDIYLFGYRNDLRLHKYPWLLKCYISDKIIASYKYEVVSRECKLDPLALGPARHEDFIGDYVMSDEIVNGSPVYESSKSCLFMGSGGNWYLGPDVKRPKIRQDCDFSLGPNVTGQWKCRSSDGVRTVDSQLEIRACSLTMKPSVDRLVNQFNSYDNNNGGGNKKHNLTPTSRGAMCRSISLSRLSQPSSAASSSQSLPIPAPNLSQSSPNPVLKPWMKYTPSPSTSAPSASILKDSPVSSKKRKMHGRRGEEKSLPRKKLKLQPLQPPTPDVSTPSAKSPLSYDDPHVIPTRPNLNNAAASRSNSVEKSSAPSANRLYRKSSEENLHRATLTQNASRKAASTGSPARRTNSTKPECSSSPLSNSIRGHSHSPIRKSSAGSSRLRNQSPQSTEDKPVSSSSPSPRHSGPRDAKPVIPTKPSHLSPQVNGKSSCSGTSLYKSSIVNKVTPTPLVTPPKSSRSNNSPFPPVTKSGPPKFPVHADTKLKDMSRLSNKNIELNLQPLETHLQTSSELLNGHKVTPVSKAEEYVKPSQAPLTSSEQKNAPAKQVGVIKPISRDLNPSPDTNKPITIEDREEWRSVSAGKKRKLSNLNDEVTQNAETAPKRSRKTGGSSRIGKVRHSNVRQSISHASRVEIESRSEHNGFGEGKISENHKRINDRKSKAFLPAFIPFTPPNRAKKAKEKSQRMPRSKAAAQLLETDDDNDDDVLSQPSTSDLVTTNVVELEKELEVNSVDLDQQMPVDEMQNDEEIDIIESPVITPKKKKKKEKSDIGDKLHQCKQCCKRFSQKSQRKSHERIHTGEKPYQCSHCSKSFALNGNLKRHERIHTGEKPYQCSQCSNIFSQISHLKRHERIHTGEKPYQCSHCSKSFARKNDVKLHERIHTGEKPYQCSQCSKSFSDPSNMKGHERIHSGQKPYQCTPRRKR